MRSSTKVPHPIPYQGSKRHLAAKILAHAPRGFTRLVEPFAGSAAVSLAASQSGLAERFWINDAHEPLVSLWRAILNEPSVLADNYGRLWQEQQGRERRYFDETRDQFNREQLPEHFLYLLARCVKAAIRYNSDGKFNNTPDNRRKGARPDDMRNRILGASALLAGKTLLTSNDYLAVLERCTPDDFIYMDPPYQGVSRSQDNRYSAKVDHAQFWDALESLNRKGCRYIVSYDGRTGLKQHGQAMPARLELTRLELCAGRSSQATLLGQNHVTFESLYLSPTLLEFGLQAARVQAEA